MLNPAWVGLLAEPKGMMLRLRQKVSTADSWIRVSESSSQTLAKADVVTHMCNLALQRWEQKDPGIKRNSTTQGTLGQPELLGTHCHL